MKKLIKTASILSLGLLLASCGKEGYDAAKKAGFEGSQDEWNEIVQNNGKSSYELAKNQGYTGSLDEFNSLIEETNKSVYEIAKAQGFNGTEEDWNNILSPSYTYIVDVKTVQETDESGRNLTYQVITKSDGSTEKIPVKSPIICLDAYIDSAYIIKNSDISSISLATNLNVNGTTGYYPMTLTKEMLKKEVDLTTVGEKEIVFEVFGKTFTDTIKVSEYGLDNYTEQIVENIVYYYEENGQDVFLNNFALKKFVGDKKSHTICFESSEFVKKSDGYYVIYNNKEYKVPTQMVSKPTNITVDSYEGVLIHAYKETKEYVSSDNYFFARYNVDGILMDYYVKVDSFTNTINYDTLGLTYLSYEIKSLGQTINNKSMEVMSLEGTFNLYESRYYFKLNEKPVVVAYNYNTGIPFEFELPEGIIDTSKPTILYEDITVFNSSTTIDYLVYDKIPMIGVAPSYSLKYKDHDRLVAAFIDVYGSSCNLVEVDSDKIIYEGSNYVIADIDGQNIIINILVTGIAENLMDYIYIDSNSYYDLPNIIVNSNLDDTFKNVQLKDYDNVYYDVAINDSTKDIYLDLSRVDVTKPGVYIVDLHIEDYVKTYELIVKPDVSALTPVKEVKIGYYTYKLYDVKLGDHLYAECNGYAYPYKDLGNNLILIDDYLYDTSLNKEVQYEGTPLKEYKLLIVGNVMLDIKLYDGFMEANDPSGIMLEETAYSILYKCDGNYVLDGVIFYETDITVDGKVLLVPSVSEYGGS